MSTPIPQPATADAFSGPPGFPPHDDPSTPDPMTRFAGRVARRTPDWVGPAALAGCCAAASAYVLLQADPRNFGADDTPTCLVRLTTGFDCPGCGGTRAAWYLLHGDLPAAAHHHMLFVFVVPFLIYAYIAWAAGAVFKVRLPQFQLSMRAVGIALAVWVVFSVLRNLPFEPFSLFYV